MQNDATARGIKVDSEWNHVDRCETMWNEAHLLPFLLADRT